MIEYMQKLDEFMDEYNYSKTIGGVSESEIRTLEKKLIKGGYFPKAYREFLEISGKECPAVDMGHRFRDLELMQKDAEKLLGYYKLNNLIEKEFFVCAELERSILYFHLDEGDDPPLYHLHAEDYAEDKEESDWGTTSSFKEWIEDCVAQYYP